MSTTAYPGNDTAKEPEWGRHPRAPVDLSMLSIAMVSIID